MCKKASRSYIYNDVLPGGTALSTLHKFLENWWWSQSEQSDPGQDCSKGAQGHVPPPLYRKGGGHTKAEEEL